MMTLLVSYPKSGNTWLRFLLENYLSDLETPVELSSTALDLEGAGSRKAFDQVTGLSSSDLTNTEIDELRPFVFETLSQKPTQKPRFLKVHEAYRITRANAPIYPSSAFPNAIYIVRNPLDVAVSFAFHANTSIDDIIEDMSNPKLFTGGRESPQIRQVLFNWSSHVKSWTQQKEISIKTIRYENLLSDPIAVFGGILDFLNLKKTNHQNRLLKAVKFSSFATLKQLEKTSGFMERTSKTTPFFRKGRVDDWKNHLTKKQAQALINTHKPVMKAFGYPTKVRMD